MRALSLSKVYSGPKVDGLPVDWFLRGAPFGDMNDGNGDIEGSQGIGPPTLILPRIILAGVGKCILPSFPKHTPLVTCSGLAHFTKDLIRNDAF